MATNVQNYIGFRPDTEVLTMLDDFRAAQVAATTTSAAVIALFKLGFEQWAKTRQPEGVGE